MKQEEEEKKAKQRKDVKCGKTKDQKQHCQKERESGVETSNRK